MFLISSIETILQGSQLREVIKVDAATGCIDTISVNHIGFPNTQNETCVCKVFVNEVIIEEYPSLVMLLTIHLQYEIDPTLT